MHGKNGVIMEIEIVKGLKIKGMCILIFAEWKYMIKNSN
jgi:hypothetical protein